MSGPEQHTLWRSHTIHHGHQTKAKEEAWSCRKNHMHVKNWPESSILTVGMAMERGDPACIVVIRILGAIVGGRNQGQQHRQHHPFGLNPFRPSLEPRRWLRRDTSVQRRERIGMI